MIIDIKRTVIKTQLRRFIILIVFCLLVLTVILLGLMGHDIGGGLNNKSWALIFGLLYIVYYVIESILELNYIFFSDEGKDIMLRYFSMSVLNKRKNSIEIPKEDFSGYEIHDYLWGIKKKIVLLHRFKDKDARYPHVSLTGLKQKELDKLTRTLDKWKVK